MSDDALPSDEGLQAHLNFMAGINPPVKAAGEVRRQLIDEGFDDRTADRLGAELFSLLMVAGVGAERS